MKEAIDAALGLAKAKEALIHDSVTVTTGLTCFITSDKVETYCKGGKPFLEIHPVEFLQHDYLDGKIVLTATMKYRRL